MNDGVLEFIEFLKSIGCAPSDTSSIVADDTPRYFHIDGDKAKTKKGSYCLAENDGFFYGWALSFRHGETHNWHSKTKRKWSHEEKQAHAERVDASRQARATQRQEAADAATAEGARIWSESGRTGESPYLTRKGITSLPGVRYNGDTLVVPMWRDGEMVAVQQIMADGFKLFLKGSDHVGAYFSIRGSLETIAICEGVSTGATVHAATGWSVICAFNAGNLKPVARAIRAKYPDARIVIAADNDHESTNQKGEPYNTGIEKAQQAAVAIGGAQVIAPESADGVTDWNDVHALEGLQSVTDSLLSVPTPQSPETEDYDQWEPDYGPEDDDVTEPATDPMDQIRPLGHNRGSYYFFPRATGQIMEFSATALGRSQNLYQLAPRGFWESMYAPEEKMSVIAEMASGDLIRLCQQKGIFSLENARGVGVWRDGKKLLVNCGNVIIGEGVKCHPSEFGGDYVYEAGQRVIDMDVLPLDNKEAARFRNVCKGLTWKKPQYGDLLAGWCVIAAVGGCLDWRPHIFITGRKGSGKSTAMDKIVEGALHGIAIKRDGGTTEPGVRKAIGASSRPFIMDEAEAESGARRTQMQLIFEYFRNASSGAVVENANASYVARSAACFGAINPRIDQGADADRWSMLELTPNESHDRDEHYKGLLSEIREVITSDFPDRLLARTVANLDVLLHNIGVFVDVFSNKLGSKRAGDQVGTLVAGSYALVSTQRVTVDFVEDWVSKQDWDFGELTGGGSDAEALFATIMSSRVRWDADGMGRESRVGDLVLRASKKEYMSMEYENACRALGGIGIRVDLEKGRIVISNGARPLKMILRDTPWGEWRRTLSDYDGADNYGGKVVSFAAGIKTKATSIPMSALGMDDEWEVEVE